MIHNEHTNPYIEEFRAVRLSLEYDMAVENTFSDKKESHNLRVQKEVIDSLKESGLEVSQVADATFVNIDANNLDDTNVKIVLEKLSHVHASVFNEGWKTIKTPKQSYDNIVASLSEVDTLVSPKISVMIVGDVVVGAFIINTPKIGSIDNPEAINELNSQVAGALTGSVKKLFTFSRSTKRTEVRQLENEMLSHVGEIKQAIKAHPNPCILADELFIDSKLLKRIIEESGVNFLENLLEIKGPEFESLPKQIQDTLDSLKPFEKMALTPKERNIIAGRFYTILNVSAPLAAIKESLKKYDLSIVFWTSPSVPKATMSSIFYRFKDRLPLLFGRGPKSIVAQTALRARSLSTFPFRRYFSKSDVANIMGISRETHEIYKGRLLSPEGESKLSTSSPKDSLVLVGGIPIDVLDFLTNIPGYLALTTYFSKSTYRKALRLFNAESTEI